MKPGSESDRVSTFSDQEIEQMHADDFQAGRIVVGLITGVFVIGLLMYSFICWLVM